MKKAIFAGSFDPLHEGHLQIIRKATKIFDELWVIVANNNLKINQRDLVIRKKEVQSKLANFNVKVELLNTKYLATFALQNNIKYLVRSARNKTDFQYELDMAKLNQKINSQLETILIIPSYDNLHYSSSYFKNFDVEEDK